MALVFLRASSNRRTITSHLVVLQMCFALDLIWSENSVKPAARSTASTVGKVVRLFVLKKPECKAYLEPRSFLGTPRP